MSENPDIQFKTDEEHARCMFNRRQFLMTGAAAIAVTTVMIHVPGLARAVPAEMVRYPRKKIGKISALKTDKPVVFNYPDEGLNSISLLVRLGEEAGGGIGPKKDIVAFNSVCTHQGMTLLETNYKAKEKVLGACPLHLSTYDLTRHGIIVSGQAYQSLPQVLLETEGDDIYAVGVMGLIFGRNDNILS